MTANAFVFTSADAVASDLKKAAVGLANATIKLSTVARVCLLADGVDGAAVMKVDREQAIARAITLIGPGKDPKANNGKHADQPAKQLAAFRAYQAFRVAVAREAKKLGLKVTFDRKVTDDGAAFVGTPSATIEVLPQEKAPAAPRADNTTPPANAEGAAAPAAAVALPESVDVVEQALTLIGDDVDAAARLIQALTDRFADQIEFVEQADQAA